MDAAGNASWSKDIYLDNVAELLLNINQDAEEDNIESLNDNCFEDEYSDDTDDNGSHNDYTKQLELPYYIAF